MNNLFTTLLIAFLFVSNIAFCQNCSFQILNSKGQPLKTKLTDVKRNVILPDRNGKYLIKDIGRYDTLHLRLGLQNQLSYLVYDLDLYLKPNDQTPISDMNINLRSLCANGFIFYLKNKEKRLDN